ncbi:N-terminal nucleophile aminohydrolase, partial [Martensiomyces pterosporus]
VHVGAGYHSQHKSKAYKQAMRQACDAAIAKLTHGASANDAAECAIKALEDSPVTNAGIGSNLNRLGLVECDASMMCTDPDAFGAVGAVSEICNPIQAANALLKTSSRGPDQLAGLVPPMLLVGRGADEWAKTQGVPTSSNTREKITEESLKKYEGYMKRAFSVAVEEDEEGLLMDTVGAVCIDGSGNIAAGVSSGGIALKLPGRIGEASMFGSGCWAERRSNDSGDSKATVGCSVTGTGEQIMRTMLAKDCAQR